MYSEEFLEDAQTKAEAAIARLENEPSKAYSGFLVYLNLPAGQRSLSAAYRAYRPDTGPKQAQAEGETVIPAPGYFRSWSSTFNWKERAELHDFQTGIIARARQAEQHIADIQDCNNRVKQTSLNREAFFARVNGYCHRRLTEFERADLRAAKQAAEWQDMEADAQLGGKEFKPPKGRAILPTPTGEVESLVRTYARASLILDGGLSAEMKALEIDSLLAELNTQRQKDEQD